MAHSMSVTSHQQHADHVQVIHAVAIAKTTLEFPSDAPERYAQLARRCMSHVTSQRPHLCRGRGAPAWHVGKEKEAWPRAVQLLMRPKCSMLLQAVAASQGL